MAGLLGGLLSGVLLPGSTLMVACVYWTVATAYGYLVWRRAEAGYLPFPDSD